MVSGEAFGIGADDAGVGDGAGRSGEHAKAADNAATAAARPAKREAEGARVSFGMA
jgi:hypothetical protein